MNLYFQPIGGSLTPAPLPRFESADSLAFIMSNFYQLGVPLLHQAPCFPCFRCLLLNWNRDLRTPSTQHMACLLFASQVEIKLRNCSPYRCDGDVCHLSLSKQTMRKDFSDGENPEPATHGIMVRRLGI